jgi:hypothetical protein
MAVRSCLVVVFSVQAPVIDATDVLPNRLEMGKLSWGLRWRWAGSASVAVVVQCRRDRFFHRSVYRFGAAQVSPLLLAQAPRQMAGAALAMHAPAFGRQPKAFLGAFMSLDLGTHGFRSIVEVKVADTLRVSFRVPPVRPVQ